jgi:hypothetical protein
LAFWLLALNQALIVLVSQPSDSQSWIYLLRVAAFVLIAIAIIRKNAGGSDPD